MAFDRLLPVWRPLSIGDVVLNLYDSGRMWGTHYFSLPLTILRYGSVGAFDTSAPGTSCRV